MTDWRALSIRQPYAWAVVNAGKCVENRKQAPPAHMVGQPFLVHASKGLDLDSYPGDCWSIVAASETENGMGEGMHPPRSSLLKRGGVVGVAWLTGWARRTDDGSWIRNDPAGSIYRIMGSPWFSGPVGYLLEHVQPLPFTPCRGALGFWKVPPEVTEELEDDLFHALAVAQWSRAEARMR